MTYPATSASSSQSGIMITEPLVALPSEEQSSYELTLSNPRVIGSSDMALYCTSGDISVEVKMTSEQRAEFNRRLESLRARYPNMESVNLTELIAQVRGDDSSERMPIDLDADEEIYEFVNFLTGQNIVDGARLTRRYSDIKGDLNAPRALIDPQAMAEGGNCHRLRNLLSATGRIETSHPNLFSISRNNGRSKRIMGQRLLAVRLWKEGILKILNERIASHRNTSNEANIPENIKREAKALLSKLEIFRERIVHMDQFAIEYAITHPYTDSQSAKADLQELHTIIEQRPGEENRWYRRNNTPSLRPHEKEYALDIIAMGISAEGSERRQNLLVYHDFMAANNSRIKRDSLEEGLMIRNIDQMFADNAQIAQLKFNCNAMGLRGDLPAFPQTEIGLLKERFSTLAGFIMEHCRDLGEAFSTTSEIAGEYRRLWQACQTRLDQNQTA